MPQPVLSPWPWIQPPNMSQEHHNLRRQLLVQWREELGFLATLTLALPEYPVCMRVKKYLGWSPSCGDSFLAPPPNLEPL